MFVTTKAAGFISIKLSQLKKKKKMPQLEQKKPQLKLQQRESLKLLLKS